MKTLNYQIFKFKEENRTLSRKKINEIKESILKYGYENGLPILVDLKFYIQDGQHRFIACKELGIVVIYEFTLHHTSEYMRSLNKANSGWEVADYIKSYASEKRQCYLDLLEFKEKYNFTISSSIIACFGSKSMNRIRNGEDIEILPTADLVGKSVLAFNQLRFYKTKNFIIAVQTIINKKISDKHLQVLIDKQLLINEMAQSTHYLKVFEALINNRRGKRENVNFTN